MSSVDRLCEQLKAQGRRLTPQRRAIIQALLNDGDHPTAEQLFTRVRQDMPDISHATVYNTLRELVEMNVLRELDLGLGERHYDFTTESHAHLVCLGCGRVEDVPHDSDSEALPAKHAHGFRVVDCNVIFRGYCPACLNQEH
jgi:Fur family peroxide stress response transcriptional regulator